MSNYSFQSGKHHSFIWFGVIQRLQNKYLIWFDWEHTSPLCLSDATEAAEYISMREWRHFFFLPTRTTFPFYDHIKFRLKKQQKTTDIIAPPHVFSAKSRIHPHWSTRARFHSINCRKIRTSSVKIKPVNSSLQNNNNKKKKGKTPSSRLVWRKP